MFVVNFDFSSFSFIHKVLAVNIPVVLTEILTYPLQRIQTQLIKKEVYSSKNQVSQISHILRDMIKVQGFPKCYHGFRYSLDYSITQMTFKFFLFDHLIVSQWAHTNKYAAYMSCVIANAVGTLASQSAFNYQTIASSLEPNRNNTPENVAKKLIAFTGAKSAFKNGLKYTLPVSIINSILQVFMISKLEGRFLKAPEKSDNELAPLDYGYTKQELLIASIVLATTSITNHFVIQRQIELCFDINKRYNYWKGFAGTLMRNMGKGMMLYCLYLSYFEWMTDTIFHRQFFKPKEHNTLPEYYQSRGRSTYSKDT